WVDPSTNGWGLSPSRSTGCSSAPFSSHGSTSRHQDTRLSHCPGVLVSLWRSVLTATHLCSTTGRLAATVMCTVIRRLAHHARPRFRNDQQRHPTPTGGRLAPPPRPPPP